MKRILFPLTAGLVTAAGSVHAQDASACVPSCYGNPVVYPMMVVYQAAVVYTAPVIYQAPVFYLAPPAPVYTQTCHPAPASTVTVIGGGHSCTTDYYPACDSGTQVIYFGSRQACQQGYQFSRPR